MNLSDFKVITSPFKEHPTVNFTLQEPERFDISTLGREYPSAFTKNNTFDLEAYCICLIYKIFELDRSELKPFLEFQTSRVQDSFCWLNKLEKLIQLNEALFKNDTARFTKLYTLIQSLRDKIPPVNDLLNHSSFDFKRFLKDISCLETIEEKLIILKEKRTVLLQANVLNFNELNEKNIKLIDLEISKLTDLQAVNSPQNSKRPKRTVNKLKFNGNTNILADVFFQLINEKTVDGKPLLEADIKLVTDFLFDNFIDKDSKELSQSSLKTMLTPSRYDKRPKGDKRIKVANN